MYALYVKKETGIKLKNWELLLTVNMKIKFNFLSNSWNKFSIKIIHSF
jgi:hypothetical protein